MAVGDWSAWDTLVRSDVVQGYTESPIVLDGSYIKKVHTNQAALIFPIIARSYPANAADGAAVLGITGATESAVTLALDNPCKLHRDIPDSAMNTQQITLEGDYAKRLGKDLRCGHDNRLIAFALNQAVARSTAGLVNWQDTPAVQSTTELRGDAAGEALSDILKNFAAAEIGDDVRKYVVFHPDLFFNLLNSRFVRSRDFTTDTDNAGNVSRIRFGGLTVTSAVSVLNQDEDPVVKNVTAPDKYKGDFTGLFGVAWAEDALGVGYVEPLHVASSYEASREGLLIRARTHFGTVATQPTGYVQVTRVDNT